MVLNCFLFVDELHRFNKAQQDLLLPDVESGEVRLIGATTHNPRYYIIDPLLSRCQLLTLDPLPAKTIEKLSIMPSRTRQMDLVNKHVPQKIYS